MKLSTRGRYAFRMMLELALGEEGRPVMLHEIARRQGISSRYLGQLTHNLKSAGLIRSVRGKRGGFLLNRPPEEITLLEIFQASEGSPMIVDCLEETGCDKSGHCATREIWEGLSRLVSGYLSERTLARLVRRHREITSPEQVDYTI